MGRERFLRWEHLATHFTQQRQLVRVAKHVSLEMRQSTKLFATNLAHPPGTVSVSCHVPVLVVDVVEDFPAFFTLKISLLQMVHVMVEKLHHVREHRAAPFTLEPAVFPVRPHVHLEH